MSYGGAFYTDNFDLESTAMGSTIYINNLDSRVSELLLYNMFNQFFPGHIVNLKYTEDPNGVDNFCFVTFRDVVTATSALSLMNGRKIFDKCIKVTWAANSVARATPTVSGTSFSIYVGDIGHEVDDTVLYNSFIAFGDVLSARVVRDPDSGISKGFGFVVYRHQTEAEEAINKMNGEPIGDRNAKVSWATRSKTSSAPQFNYNEVYGQSNVGNTTLYVGNLPPNMTEQHLASFFEPYGAVVETKIFQDKHFAFIKMDSHEAAATAIIKLNGYGIEKCTIKVWWSRDNTVVPGNIAPAAGPPTSFYSAVTTPGNNYQYYPSQYSSSTGSSYTGSQAKTQNYYYPSQGASGSSSQYHQSGSQK